MRYHHKKLIIRSASAALGVMMLLAASSAAVITKLPLPTGRLTFQHRYYCLSHTPLRSSPCSSPSSCPARIAEGASAYSTVRRRRQPQSFDTPMVLKAQEGSSNSKDSSGGGVVESLFKFIRSDALSLTIGSLCLLALVINRLFTEDLFDSQSRTDILGVFSAGGLLLNGLTLQDITVREAESVALQGPTVDDAAASLTPRQATVLRWAGDTYMQAFPSTTSFIVWYKGQTLLRKGIVSASSSTNGKVEVLAILQKALTLPPEIDGLSQPTYIPDLQVLPGRFEFFNFLPDLCQAVVIQPFDNNQGLVILGGNKRRDLTPKDLAKARVIAQKVQSTLAE